MLPAYAADRATADRTSLDEATEFAKRQYADLLPQGVNTPGHFFAWVLAGGVEGPVGFVWYFTSPERREAFIYDLWIGPEHRRRGYATAALAAVADDARRRGCERLGLNVFATNPGAAALYRKCGFEVVASHMNRPL